ncbi:MAG: hypothetical protein J2P24_04245 [Streptosporangiales bacterium]|nr:hypothetical protein [Streptosporangiales bacterium]
MEFMEPVDYVHTLIAVAEDCPVTDGTPPPVEADKPSVAARTHRMLVGAPYRYTSGDVSSVLGKRYGWGVHADGDGHLALHGAETPEYRELLASDDLTVRKGFRSASGPR